MQEGLDVGLKFKFVLFMSKLLQWIFVCGSWRLVDRIVEYGCLIGGVRRLFICDLPIQVLNLGDLCLLLPYIVFLLVRWNSCDLELCYLVAETIVPCMVFGIFHVV